MAAQVPGELCGHWLFGEEIGAATGEQRGNLPQEFTHMCVINHAVRLEECIRHYGLVD